MFLCTVLFETLTLKNEIQFETNEDFMILTFLSVTVDPSTA